MKKTKYLLVTILPLIFAAGCIDGVAVLSINKDGSGKVTFEGLFNYPACCAIMNTDCNAAKPFFLSQVKKILTSDTFETWSDVTWKILDNGKCYFKGTAYFKDINMIDFSAGEIKSNLKLFYKTNQAPTVELKFLPDKITPENQQMASMPPELLKTLNVNIVVSPPGDINETENFELLDRQTAMFTLAGKDFADSGLGEYFKNKGVIKLTLASAGKDLFDYQSQVQAAQKDFEEILNKIQAPKTAKNAEKPAVKNDFNGLMRQGLAAEAKNDFNEALAIYEGIINAPNADEKCKAAASYQTGVCYLKMGDRDKAQSQFEYVIKNYSMQRTAAPKAMRMLQNIRLGVSQKTQELPFVVDTIPQLYSEDVDPNTDAITIIFSEPMKQTNWFYSSFPLLPPPTAACKPFFDPCGIEWTLPAELEPGKVYTIAVNYSGSEISELGSTEPAEVKSQIPNVQTGFRSVRGRKCQPYILIFATRNEKQFPTVINEKVLEQCDKINFQTGEQENGKTVEQ